MAKTKIHVGLEIGTSKTCMVVGEVKPDATVTIIGVGEVPSEGVVRGEIEDTSKVIQCIYDAWNMAQDHADVDIMTVYLSVTGAHIVGQNNRGTFRLPPDESIISQEHMDEVTEIARDIALGPEQFVLHRVPGLFSVDGQEKRYTLTAEGDDASTLLRLLTSDEIANAASLSAIHVDLTAESGELMDVSFTAENSGDLRVEAAAHFTDALAPVIPDDVLTAIHSGSNDDASTLTDNALRLLGAWGELTADDLSADIALSADCGPIVLNSTLQYDRSSIDGQSYGSIQKNTLAVYFSGSKICDADGNSVDTANQQLVDATSLIDLCYQSILNGSAGCDKASDGYLYGLSLDSDAMSELAAAIAPDIKAQDVTFSSGRISVCVSEQGELQSVNISCSGALHLILSDAPVSLSAVITPADRAFSIPQPALNALKQ